MTTPTAAAPTPADPTAAAVRPYSRARRFAWTAVLAAVLVPALWHFASPLRAWRQYQPMEGDVLFQSLPRQEIVNAIEGATGSPWSHCGIVARENGGWVVYEAIEDVHKTPLDEFYRRGREGRFAAFRLKEKHRAQVPAVLEKARAYLGRPYDVRYRWDDEAIYCSELIFKAYRDATGESLGKRVKLGELKWRPYQQIIERLEGGPVPVDREMITPRDLAKAEQFERIAGSDPAEEE